MNILLLSWRDPFHPNAGGAEISTLEHAKAWIRAGCKVTWFSSYFFGAKSEEIIDGIEIVRAGKQFFDVQIRAFFWYLWGEHPKFDLVLDQFHGLPFFTPFYVGGKKLAFIHEVAKEVWKLNPWPFPFNLVPAFLGPILEPVIFLFYRNIPFMTVSESTKKDLMAWGVPEKNINVIHNGVNLDGFTKDLPSKEKTKTLIYLGAISRDKGIEDAFLAFSEIQKKDRRWQFWVVGKASEDYLRWMKVTSRRLALGSNFKYWGFVNDYEKFKLLSRAHILINPSYHEGWGLVNIEANSVGTPVVGYSVQGMVDSVVQGRTGVLVKKGDFKKLAEAVTGLVDAEEEYKEYQKNCRKWAGKFSWKKSTPKSLKLINNFVKKDNFRI